MTKILIVEDEKDLREAIRVSLEAESFTVFEAANGESGVQTAFQEKPDVILMDINLPEMTGHEAVAKIREDQWGKDVKVVYLTAYSDAENVVAAVEGGSEEYIVKGNTSLEEIVAKVKQVYHNY